MEKVINKKTKIVKEIPKYLVSDYLSTKEWEVEKNEEKDLQKTKSKPVNNNDIFENID